MNLMTARIVLVSLSALAVSAFAAGGNLAPCRSDSNCAGERSCRAFALDLSSISTIFQSAQSEDLENPDSGTVLAILQSITQSCRDEDYCLCVPTDEDLIGCSSDSDCSDGEECLADNCVADSQLEAAKEPKSCSSDSDCTVPDTICAKLTAGLLDSLAETFGFEDNGFCLARFKESSTSGKPGSSSTTTDGGNDNNDDDDDDSEICIAVKSLRHLQPHQLVYRKHMTARVLCDTHGSCATAGHMVRFRGRAMMMKSYCELVGNCERSITLVNSPRYTRALQIPSDSPDLTFTAFAARYATTAEEHVLRTAVHIGL
ncbi:hypothetical protein BWQ96_10029 [Gracilariopsis chorda]|uniref:Uncharacterized protein n=1 Tax=Gracilariopsis chorda TaxID=448386 RepID=A0A2V3IDX8_9FLOR|nr:hypothetical protein BWQ96_10029 [Gracilariopsis chorda]|eukprot:PXF40267.1 hypothetical protein BWQ96_10029 [Gracilariopsis chorda]